MPRPRKNITLNFLEIESFLNDGLHVDLKALAAQHGTCSPVIRRILCEAYGCRIAFKPGRNGGLRWSVASGNAPATQFLGAIPTNVPSTVLV
jgi:hypothetical protein